eukprot:scaffold249333_cov19-Prasinocladus_malaysianus.AAC.1
MWAIRCVPTPASVWRPESSLVRIPYPSLMLSRERQRPVTTKGTSSTGTGTGTGTSKFEVWARGYGK